MIVYNTLTDDLNCSQNKRMSTNEVIYVNPVCYNEFTGLSDTMESPGPKKKV